MSVFYALFAGFVLGAIVGDIFGRSTTMTRAVVDPVGWDEQAQRVHDVGFQVDGALMHYSTCWCREPAANESGDGS